MNDHKITFVICSNNDVYLEEALRYLDHLIIPDGFEADVQVIHEAKSMLLGMEEGASSTDAKYKVYMHQDVFIINPYFIQNIIDLFESDKSIGLIGMVGANKMPSDGVMWHSQRFGNLWGNGGEKDRIWNQRFSNEVPIAMDALVVDGLLMATAYDVPLRTDILDGWDFYDVSTSLEYKRAGYRVVVPVQHIPWCNHQDGGSNALWNYDRLRRVVLDEYKEFFE